MGRDYKLGKTIVGAHGRDRAVELKRLAERKKRRRRNMVVGIGCAVIGVGLIIWVAIGIAGMMSEQDAVTVKEPEWEPTVEIIVEGGGSVSDRMVEFVAKLERDFSDLGLGVNRVILPQGKSRELDVYLVDRLEYYKMSVDRGSAVQAEDAERMMRYLDERGVVADYVDLRVEGKAYYK